MKSPLYIFWASSATFRLRNSRSRLEFMTKYSRDLFDRPDRSFLRANAAMRFLAILSEESGLRLDTCTSLLTTTGDEGQDWAFIGSSQIIASKNELSITGISIVYRIKIKIWRPVRNQGPFYPATASLLTKFWPALALPFIFNCR